MPQSIDRQRRDERLALAGLHLGDLAVVEHLAADQLHVVVPHAQRALADLAHGGEGVDEQVVERGPVLELLLELDGARGELLIRELLQLRLQRVDAPPPGRLQLA